MNTKQSTLVILLFCLALIVGLVINLPVIQVFRYIDLPDGIKIQGIEGTIAKGQVNQIEIQGYPLSEIEYQIQPLCLLKLSACYRLKSDYEDLILNLEGSLLTQQISVKKSNIAISQSVFDRIPNLLVKPAGDFRVIIDILELDSKLKLTDLKGSVEWDNAGVEGEEQVLGNYLADIVTQNEGLSIKLSDKGSLLGVNGGGEVSWKGGFSLDLNLLHRPELNPSVISILDISAKKSGLNQYKLQKSGQLPSNIVKGMAKFIPAS